MESSARDLTPAGGFAAGCYAAGCFAAGCFAAGRRLRRRLTPPVVVVHGFDGFDGLEVSELKFERVDDFTVEPFKG